MEAAAEDANLRVFLEAFWKDIIQNKSQDKIGQKIQVFRISTHKVSSQVVKGDFEDYTRITFRLRPRIRSD